MYYTLIIETPDGVNTAVITNAINQLGEVKSVMQCIPRDSVELPVPGGPVGFGDASDKNVTIGHSPRRSGHLHDYRMPGGFCSYPGCNERAQT